MNLKYLNGWNVRADGYNLKIDDIRKQKGVKKKKWAIDMNAREGASSSDCVQNMPVDTARCLSRKAKPLPI